MQASSLAQLRTQRQHVARAPNHPINSARRRGMLHAGIVVPAQPCSVPFSSLWCCAHRLVSRTMLRIGVSGTDVAVRVSAGKEECTCTETDVYSFEEDEGEPPKASIWSGLRR